MCGGGLGHGDGVMPITAINQEVLELFNSLLHDLYFKIPPDGFKVQEGQVCVLLTDKDHCIHKDIVARYQLYIQSVIDVENRGWPTQPACKRGGTE